MTRIRQVWQLRHGRELVGELVVTDGDFPWLNGTFTATAAFGPWRDAFDNELRLLEEIDEHVEQWEAAYRRIDENLTLHDQTGKPVAEFLLHIEDEKAWWRWSDDPFPADPT